jgi:glucose-1-phosphate adenylyltransferase
MNKMMGIIFALGDTGNMLELTKLRAASAMPVGGKYRTIDFPLSNMVNADIVNIGILTQYNYRSLMDHLGSGKEWDLDRKNDGLFLFPPYLNQSGTGWYRGTADALFTNLSFLTRSDEEYVVISDGSSIYKTNLNEMLREHLANKSDITVMIKKMSEYTSSRLQRFGQVIIDNNNRIIDYAEKPVRKVSDVCSTNVFLLKRELLISLIQDCIARGSYDFIVDIIMKNLGKLDVHGFFYPGYFRNMSTVEEFFGFNMDLLDPDLLTELFINNGRIFTKVKDEVPAKYNDEAEVSNSIVADGCIIEGKVENSVLFRGVTINRGVFVKNCIIMQSSIIELNSTLEYVIVDKQARITENKHLRGEASWPLIISKDALV